MEKPFMFLANYALLWSNQVHNCSVFTVLARTSLYRIPKAHVRNFNGYMTAEAT